MSFRCGIQLWQSGCVLQRNDGASEHIKTINLFAGSVISGGASPQPGPLIEACDKEQYKCKGNALNPCLLDDNCESLASKCCETIDSALCHLHCVFLD